MICLEYKFKMKGIWLKKVLKIRITRKKFDIIKCLSQYLRIMSLKMTWVWIWATFGIQTDCASACAAGPPPWMQAPGRLVEGCCSPGKWDLHSGH